MGDATELRFVLTEWPRADEIHKAIGKIPPRSTSNSSGEGIQDGWNTHDSLNIRVAWCGDNLSGSFSAMESLNPQGLCAGSSV